ncbi:MAG: hypothetical protein FWD57_11190 [Polyangiaceae bacterium]|nr:hypothetical protein [Polyangiaceae bacterium]
MKKAIVIGLASALALTVWACSSDDDDNNGGGAGTGGGGDDADTGDDGTAADGGSGGGGGGGAEGGDGGDGGTDAGTGGDACDKATLESCIACGSTPCSAQGQECYIDETCRDMVYCFLNCETDACRDDCVDETSPAFDRFDALWICLDANCKTECWGDCD